MKRIIDEALKITQIETMFRDKYLAWYMMYKMIMPVGQMRSLA
jgi:hypothetical protein